MWSGGIDPCGPSEDPRATRGGDTFSVAERAAVADGSRFREVQRELRGSKPESRGTEIEKFTTRGVAPRTTDEDHWKLFFVEAFVLHSPVIDHGHHAGIVAFHWPRALGSSAFEVPWWLGLFRAASPDMGVPRWWLEGVVARGGHFFRVLLPGGALVAPGLFGCENGRPPAR
jgi:hypothetical protein